ncbi:MAG TPA: hypothetical protein DEH78_17440, partial [Solibacterales bacterium]|nr:hypothetical protein [Bryobacterales bacterium]
MTIRTALCFLTCHLTAAPLVLAQAPPAPTGRVIRENVSWADVPARVTNRRVLVALTDGSFATGRVTNVTGAEIELRGRDRPVPRDSVKFVQYEIAKGKSRARWAVGLALAGIGIAVLLGV